MEISRPDLRNTQDNTIFNADFFDKYRQLKSLHTPSDGAQLRVVVTQGVVLRVCKYLDQIFLWKDVGEVFLWKYLQDLPNTQDNTYPRTSFCRLILPSTEKLHAPSDASMETSRQDLPMERSRPDLPMERSRRYLPMEDIFEQTFRTRKMLRPRTNFDYRHVLFYFMALLGWRKNCPCQSNRYLQTLGVRYPGISVVGTVVAPSSLKIKKCAMRLT